MRIAITKEAFNR